MAVYPGSPYGFGGMPYRSPYGGMGQGLPPGQMHYSSTSQYTITQPINTGGGGFMSGGQMPMGNPAALFGGMPQPQVGFGGQGYVPPLNSIGMQFQPQAGFGGQPMVMQQPNPMLGLSQFPTGGMPLNLGGSQFGGGGGGLQGFSNGGNVPSIQQLGAQAFGQWPVGVFSPQARLA